MHMPPLNLTPFPIILHNKHSPNSIYNTTNTPPLTTLFHPSHLLEFLLEIMEDDLFFADLSKQISLLVMDEDDGDVALSPPWHSYPLQDMSYVMASTQNIQGQGQQPRNVQEKNHQEGMREMSKGTGVFIPKFAQPRRKRTTFNHHPSRHNHSYSPNNNYSRPNDHHYRHQHLDYYTPRRFSQEESKANYYFINPDKI